MKTVLAVLFGGISSEYEVSLHSAAAVVRAVDLERYKLLQVGITRSGQWLLYPGGADAMENDTWWQNDACVPCVLSPSREDHGLWLMYPADAVLRSVDVAFPVLHGRGGEDGAVQGLLELSGIPFVGCGLLSSALCMDKQYAHMVAGAAGIACPAFVTVHAQAGWGEEALAPVFHQLGHLPFPWYVKPAAEGSSFGVARVDKKEDLAPALANAFRYGGKVVVEQGIAGFEVGCAVLGDDAPETGAIDAISLAGGFFDFHEKYTLETAKILLPAPVDEAAADAIRETALRLYRLFGCRGFARVDLFLTEDGQVIFNEINTIPGLTPHSRYPGMMRCANLGFAQLIDRLLKGALAP